MNKAAPWITYRPELKVLDCTVRDGGLINNHQFTDDLVRAVYETCISAGIDCMEIGYKNSARIFPKDEYGDWRHCDEDDLNRVVGGHDAEATGLKLVAMADAEKERLERSDCARRSERTEHDPSCFLCTPGLRGRANDRARS